MLKKTLFGLTLILVIALAACAPAATEAPAEEAPVEDSRRKEVRIACIDIGDLVDRALKLVRHQAELASIEVRVDQDPALKPIVCNTACSLMRSCTDMTVVVETKANTSPTQA